MGRKGGGKKAFLKGVVAKPDAEDAAEVAAADQAPAEPRGGPAGPINTETSPQSLADSAAHVQVPEVSCKADDISSESKGQLTQRHKKARHNFCTRLPANFERRSHLFFPNVRFGDRKQRS